MMNKGAATYMKGDGGVGEGCTNKDLYEGDEEEGMNEENNKRMGLVRSCVCVRWNIKDRRSLW